MQKAEAQKLQQKIESMTKEVERRQYVPPEKRLEKLLGEISAIERALRDAASKEPLGSLHMPCISLNGSLSSSSARE